jgi:hypothetical protein
MLISISSPYSKAGLMFDVWRQYWGHAGQPAIVWQATTQLMNPTLSAEVIERALVEDREAALSEWMAEWRSDVSSYVEREVVEAVVVRDRTVLPPAPSFEYKAFADPAGGAGQDSFALAIGHRGPKGQVVLDFLAEKKPPFSPERAVSEFCEILRTYKIIRISGDKFGGMWPVEVFRRHGVLYQATEKSSSELYLELLPVLSSGRVEILDSSRLVSQLANLERRTRGGGRDLVSHFRGQHDDLANVVAGVCSILSKESRPGRVYFAGKTSGLSRVALGRQGRVYFSRAQRRNLDHEQMVRESVSRWRKPPDGKD